MILSEKYKKHAVREIPTHGLTGKVGWSSPSNIALVKYWGKHEGQIPMNPSVSFTLNKCRTNTIVKYNISRIRRGLVVEYTFAGQRNEAFEKRALGYLKLVEPYFPFLEHVELKIESDNTFPHSSGIASSASAFSALALIVLDIESKLYGAVKYDKSFFTKASFFARLGSGSAARSIFPGVSLWGKTDALENSTHEAAISIESVHPIFNNYQDIILIIDADEKAVSSSAGHSLMDKNPYSEVRFNQAHKHTEKLLKILEEGKVPEFIELVEYEALCLHAMMMTSHPGYFLMAPDTLLALEKIREFRNTAKVPVCFTLDAGANVHLLFPKDEFEMVKTFVDKELAPLCAQGQLIVDEVGQGPEKLY